MISICAIAIVCPRSKWLVACFGSIQCVVASPAFIGLLVFLTLLTNTWLVARVLGVADVNVVVARPKVVLMLMLLIVSAHISAAQLMIPVRGAPHISRCIVSPSATWSSQCFSGAH